MLRQVMSSTKPTAPNRSHRLRMRSGGRKSFCRCSTDAPQPLLELGYAAAIWLVTASISACACCSVTPGFKLTHRQQPMVVVVNLLRPEGQRNRQLKVKTIRQTRRQHSHDGIGFAIDADRLADHASDSHPAASTVCKSR